METIKKKTDALAALRLDDDAHTLLVVTRLDVAV